MSKSKADWLVWGGWVGNHDMRIEGAKCSNCSFVHPTVFKSLDNLYKICPNCGSKMSVKVDA